MLDYILSWGTLWWLMFLLYLPSCLGLVVIVLLQKGKGAGFAGAFGVGGGSDTVFGPRMAKSLPQRLTYTMAGIFMVLALVLSLVGGKVSRGGAPDEVVMEAPSDLDSLLQQNVPETPATPEANTAPVSSAPEAAAPETAAPAAAPEAAAPVAAPEAPAPASTPEAPAPAPTEPAAGQ